MSQEKLTNLATDEIVTRLVKRFEEGDENVEHSVMITENEMAEALPHNLTTYGSDALINLLIRMGFNPSSLNPAYAIFERSGQSLNIFQLPFYDSLKTFMTFPKDFSNSERNVTWNRRSNGSELLTITSLLGKQVISARYETMADPTFGDDIFTLAQVDMSEMPDNHIKADRTPVSHAGLIPIKMLLKAHSLDVRNVFDIRKPQNPDIQAVPSFIPKVLNPKS